MWFFFAALKKFGSIEGCCAPIKTFQAFNFLNINHADNHAGDDTDDDDDNNNNGDGNDDGNGDDSEEEVEEANFIALSFVLLFHSSFSPFFSFIQLKIFCANIDKKNLKKKYGKTLKKKKR